MSTPGSILKRRLDYSTEKVMSDTLSATFRAGLMLYFKNQTNFLNDGSFANTRFNIIDRTVNITDETPQIIFCVLGIKKGIFDLDNEFDWVEKGGKLYEIAYAENISDREELVFNFIYEYLKLNPKDYFWVDSYEWVFSLDDMEKLRKLPFDSEWCYKDPKLVK
ncbi:hypothetical protein [Clostridium sp. C8-1-8]|uniref:hypothetical protein n=1 Tax=Clostridium sp. C8-1-8 TaxID=2698831 RepID=UPI001369D5F5|nr:hypothetical protein [Clostridium sp. C8-1-8]